MLVTDFLEVPLFQKFDAMRNYAKFHFYPVYFLTHTIDQILTNTFINLENYLDEKRMIIPRISNFIFHLLNSIILFQLLKKILNTKDNILIFISVIFFCIHPIVSQPLFNVTTRNELLYILFSLATFNQAFSFIEKNNWQNCLKVNVLFFLALCSKLFAITYLLIIPLFFITKFYYTENLKKNFEKISVLFLSLLVTFLCYQAIRYLNTQSYHLIIDNNFFFNLFSSLDFYMKGLFIPYEHFFTNVTIANTNFYSGLCFFLIFFSIFLFSVFKFLKRKNFTLLFYFFWLGASLALPLYFGVLLPESFPLTSELNERYAYGASVTVPLAIALILQTLKNNNFNYLCAKILLFFYFSCFSFLLIDRSKVYKDDYVFWSSATYNHDEHLYNHIVPALISNGKGNFNQAIFHAHQNFILYPDSIQNVLTLHNIYVKMGETKNAKNIYDKIYLKKFGKHPIVINIRSDELIKDKKFDEAIPMLLNVLEYYDNEELKFKTVKVHRDDFSMRDFSKDDIYFKLGVCFANIGKKKKAFEYFKNAYTYNYLHTTARYNAAILAKEFGQKELAFKLLKEAVDLNPKFKSIMNEKIKVNE